MATVTREQLLELDSEVLGRLINTVPPEIEDNIMLLLADLIAGGSIEIPNEYLIGIIDDL